MEQYMSLATVNAGNGNTGSRSGGRSDGQDGELETAKWTMQPNE
jgi:hypothetical protein